MMIDERDFVLEFLTAYSVVGTVGKEEPIMFFGSALPNGNLMCQIEGGRGGFRCYFPEIKYAWTQSPKLRFLSLFESKLHGLIIK